MSHDSGFSLSLSPQVLITLLSFFFFFMVLVFHYSDDPFFCSFAVLAIPEDKVFLLLKKT